MQKNLTELGFSTGSFGNSIENHPITKRLQILASVSINVIEIGLGREDRVGEICKILAGTDKGLRKELIDLVASFKFKTIHSPTFSEVSSVYQYSGPIGVQRIKMLQLITSELDINFVLFHPDQIDFEDSSIIESLEKFGEKLVFENMDYWKKFGKSIEDLAYVFKIFPNAKWVFDINHIFTLLQDWPDLNGDKKEMYLKIARNFLQNFGEKLAYIHLSGVSSELCDEGATQPLPHDFIHRSVKINPEEEVIMQWLAEILKYHPDIKIVDEAGLFGNIVPIKVLRTEWRKVQELIEKYKEVHQVLSIG